MSSKPRKKTAKVQGEQNALLKVYVECGGVLTYACSKIGIHVTEHYRWLNRYPEYYRRFEEAHLHAMGKIEHECYRRAVEGVEEPVGWWKGEPGGFVKRYSDSLLKFLLEANMPEKYGRRLQVSGSVDVNVQHTDIGMMMRILPLDLKRRMMREANSGGKFSPKTLALLIQALAVQDKLPVEGMVDDDDSDDINDNDDVIDVEVVDEWATKEVEDEQ